jgi:lipoprotein-releasing system permease protein
MPWFLYLALKQLFPIRTAVSVLHGDFRPGRGPGRGVLVVVTSVMGGFGYEIRRMIVETEGEVQIKSRALIADADRLVQQIERVPGVDAATPYASGVVMIVHEGRPAYPAMRGLDLTTVGRVVNLSHYIRLGSMDDLDDDSVVLSSELAQSLGVTVGGRIEIYSPLMIEKLRSDEIFLAREVRVVGILEIGHQQLDSSMLYCTVRLAQDLYGLGSSVHGINVRAKSGVGEDDLAARLNASGLPRGVQAFSWMDSFEEFLWVLNLEKGMIFFLLLFIVIVAAFSVMSSLLISVVRKTREIGLLGALGARARGVAACFCVQGVLIGFFGTAAGLLLGFVALAMRNDVVLTIARFTQREEALRRFYQFSNLPAHTAPGDIILIIGLTLVISLFAGLIPAWRAARLKPVEAFRNE